MRFQIESLYTTPTLPEKIIQYYCAHNMISKIWETWIIAASFPAHQLVNFLAALILEAVAVSQSSSELLPNTSDTMCRDVLALRELLGVAHGGSEFNIRSIQILL